MLQPVKTQMLELQTLMVILVLAIHHTQAGVVDMMMMILIQCPCVVHVVEEQQAVELPL